MPIKGWKCKDSALGELQEMYDTKSELWNDIRMLLTQKYDVSNLIIMDFGEDVIDHAVSEFEEMIRVSKEAERISEEVCVRCNHFESFENDFCKYHNKPTTRTDTCENWGKINR